MFLLDTNICIYAINGRHPMLSEKLLSIHPSEIFISSITVGEMEYDTVPQKVIGVSGQNKSCMLF